MAPPGGSEQRCHFFLLLKFLLWLQIANGAPQNARTCGRNQLQLVAVRQRAARCPETRSSRANERRPVQTAPYPFQLVRERLRGFDEFPFLILVAVFELKELRLQLPL